MDNIRRRLSVGAIWTAGGRVVSNLLGLVSTLALARLLTPADFGLVAIATVIAAIFSAITELSLSSALIQHKDPQRPHYDTAFTLSIFRSLAMAVLLVAAAWPLAIGYQDDRLIGIFFVLAATALIGGFVNPRLVDYRRRLSFHQEILSDIVTRIVGLVVSISIAFTFQSFWALVFGLLATQMTMVIMSYVLIPYIPRFSLAHWRSLFGFSGWLALSSGLNAFNWRADQLALGAIMGNGPLGQYAVGDNLASLPVRESTAPIANVLFPGFARLQDDPHRLRQAFLRSQRLLVAAALPVGVGFALIAGPFMSLVLGPEWTSAALVAEILSTIFAAHAFSMPVTPLAMSLGRTRILFVRDIINIAVRYPLIFAGLFYGGIFGLLVARCFSGAASIAIDVFLARRLAGVSMTTQVLASWRALAATGSMAACVGAVSAMTASSSELVQLALMILMGAVSYFGTTVALWWMAGKPAGAEREALDMLVFVRRLASGQQELSGNSSRKPRHDI